MKSLLLIVLVVQYSIIYSQGFVGLIYRNNSSSITYAEGQGVTFIGLSCGSEINKTGNFIKSFQIVKAEYSYGIYFIRLKYPYKMELLKWINN